MIQKINEIINGISKLPDLDDPQDLFQVKNKKLIMSSFFNDIKRQLPDVELEKRLASFDLNKVYLELYEELNAPASSVRNYLIQCCMINWSQYAQSTDSQSN